MVTEWAQRGECASNLRQISRALMSYEEKHGCFPKNLSGLYPDYLEDASMLSCPSRLIEDGDDYIYCAGRSLDLFPPCYLVMVVGQNHGARFSNILLTNQTIINSIIFRGC